ncbi:NAD(P)-binding protein [Hypoxylon cercidicola]|nr:NAD(P)-binding protein [Hypoxylon cercidicola]
MANDTSQKGGSTLRYFYRQLTVKPAPVRNVSLQAKTAIVTGANTGLGFATSRQLLELGLSKLILAVRDEEKGKAASAKLTSDLGLQQGTIEVWKLDLSVYESITSFADRAKTLERLDIVVLNAGMWSPSRPFNPQTGHEEVIQVNYISTSLLAVLLLPIAKAARRNQPQPTRITFVSSEVCGFAKFKERNEVPILPAIDKPGNVDNMDRMFLSKLLGQFFFRKLAKLVPTSIAVIDAASPGSAYDTEMNREYNKTFAGAVSKKILPFFGNPSNLAAYMITDAAVNHGEEIHGKFLSFQMVEGMAPILYTPEGERISEQLWKETMNELAFANVEGILKEIGDQETK